MKRKLSDILKNVEVLEISGSENIEITSIEFDSRKAGKGSLFAAIKGTKADGHNYISDVTTAGAAAIVCEKLPSQYGKNTTYIKVKSSSHAFGIMASNFFDNPSKKLKLVGVTGTNGKTTIVTLLYDLYGKLGFVPGLLSTIRVMIGEKTIEATHTTPDALQLNKLLKQMVDEGCSHCFMEVSSHAIDQHRIAGLNFAGGIFTNITHDHLDYHKTFDKYLKAKKRFFDDLPALAFALSNIDDKNGLVMLQNTKAIKKTYSLKRPSDFRAKIVESSFEGMQMNMDGEEFWTKMVGKFNVYNLLAVYASAILLGEDKQEILTALSTEEAVEGRFDFIRSQNNIFGIVDYAHTPDALKNVLDTINSIRTGNEELITVVGAGGDRDTAKRPAMASVASKKSTRVILTSDNPRSEDPEEIIRQMQKGVGGENYKKVISITNRKEAIKTACALAKPGDIILVAGKGHEKYQEIKGERHHFDDKEMIREYLLMNVNRN
jgi:UDP-N-acetylmuramoyl-L-alanyl-D-glutamate--2,6-diaminopimelate ligase